MKTYKPFRDNVIVQKLELKSPIILADGVGTWIKVKVLAIGPLVTEKIAIGDIVWAENMFNKFDYTKEDIGVILSKYLHLGERDDGRQES